MVATLGGPSPVPSARPSIQVPAPSAGCRSRREFQGGGRSTTPIVAIMPLSSCSRMWQWNTKRPSFGPLNMIITNTRARGGSG